MKFRALRLHNYIFAWLPIATRLRHGVCDNLHRCRQALDTHTHKHSSYVCNEAIGISSRMRASGSVCGWCDACAAPNARVEMVAVVVSETAARLRQPVAVNLNKLYYDMLRHYAIN